MPQEQAPLDTDSNQNSPNEQLPELFALLSRDKYTLQKTVDNILTLWVTANTLQPTLSLLKSLRQPFSMLFDLFGVDERLRLDKDTLPCKDFTVVYQLLSVERNQHIRLKVALDKDDLHIATITHLWPNANWYERECWDLFGIVFDGHPTLRRILLPPTFKGHPLRKEFPCR
ncbi:MAG: NADH-quinone oxidoreductase subunit C, partial [Algicola sp.]|nr:NADH-quinone oxidoreductase subunit C [Algicola sp.]